MQHVGLQGVFLQVIDKGGMAPSILCTVFGYLAKEAIDGNMRRFAEQGGSAMPDFRNHDRQVIFKVATDRVYSPEGIWVLEEAGRRSRTLGISTTSSSCNGDMAFVHLKPVGTVLAPRRRVRRD